MSRTKLPRRMVVAPVTMRRRNMDTRRRVAVMAIHDPTHHTDQGHMARWIRTRIHALWDRILS